MQAASRTYQYLIDMARTCLAQAGATTRRRASDELRRMAKEYQLRAAELDHGRLPDIGEEE